MKRKLILLQLFCAVFFYGKVCPQTPGTLTFTVTTSTAGGGYAPKHIMAIWITTSSGTFVKTRLKRAQAEVQYLTHWVSNSGQNVVDATTGATMPNHNAPNSPYTVTWDGTDINSAVVADGTYLLNIELTDKDATGSYSAFTFHKSPAQQLQNPANVTSFSNMTLNWVPSSTGIKPVDIDKIESLAFPNPFNNATNLNIDFKNAGPANVNVYSIKGELVRVLLNQYVNPGNYVICWDGHNNNNIKVPEGIYYYVISSGNSRVTGKLIFTK